MIGRPHTFYNPETGGESRAEGFVPEANVVIMAPGEPVTPEELVATSYFHINNRRRVVWLFREDDLAARAAMAAGPDIHAHGKWYSLCLRTGEKQVRRIVNADESFGVVVLSEHVIELDAADPEDFFREEAYWSNQSEADDGSFLAGLITPGGTGS